MAARIRLASTAAHRSAPLAPARAAMAKQPGAAVWREVAKTRRRARPGEPARAADHPIAHGLHRLAAYQPARQAVRGATRTKAGT
jgi:hypothetical protein